MARRLFKGSKGFEVIKEFKKRVLETQDLNEKWILKLLYLFQHLDELYRTNHSLSMDEKDYITDIITHYKNEIFMMNDPYESTPHEAHQNMIMDKLYDFFHDGEMKNTTFQDAAATFLEKFEEMIDVHIENETLQHFEVDLITKPEWKMFSLNFYILRVMVNTFIRENDLLLKDGLS